METKELTLPAFLGAALINGALPGLEDRDLSMLEEVWTATVGWHFIDMGESYFDDIYSPIIGHFAGDVAVYTLIKYND